MFENRHLDRSRQLFADQFESDGTDFLYRKRRKGAPIRVTEAERDRFVADYIRRMGYAQWSFASAFLLLIMLLFWFFPHPNSEPATIVIWSGLGAMLVPFVFVHHRIFNSPARELERRPAVGEKRTRAEARQRRLANMTYGQFASGVAAVLFLVWKVSAKDDAFHGWGIIWLLLAGVLIVGIAIQAFRKWRYER
jgi:hypothetical protein